MNWAIPEFINLAQLILAAVLGAVVGWERRYHNRLESEVRTFASVALGACAFGLVSILAAGDKVDPTRISAQVVTGIGFLGAGMILHQQNRTTGLATAALLWATAAVGLAIAHGLYLIGIVTAAVVFIVRHFPTLLKPRYVDDDPSESGPAGPPGK
ncbi:MAG: MgtC/SapB family protein [Chromatiaceae bacterium]|jgi:putative Mg2+ transporter-C (MgtC) family protein|nr:MgtC/SapB family protein [Chromatiaceae bacterium]MBP8289204.1 MgtC/SapB family protein [Chromatiaceae bacterium]